MLPAHASVQVRIQVATVGTGFCLFLPQHVLDGDRSFLQERQRLETILNLCAEYTKTDGTEPGDTHRLLAGDTDAGQWVPRSAMALGHAVEGLQQRESVERSDEENLKEECSSTESTHHEVGGHLCHSVTMPRCTVPCQSALSTAREADRPPGQGGTAAGGGACWCPRTPGPAEGSCQGAGAAAAGDIARGERSGHTAGSPAACCPHQSALNPKGMIQLEQQS